MGPAIRDRSADAALIDDLVAGIGLSVRQAALAEERLAAFAFHEGGPSRELSPPSSGRYFIGRALAAAGDPALVRLLELCGAAGVSMTDLLEQGDLGVQPGDRVALAERVAEGAARGLVTRELEGDRVARTPLGSALLGLVDALEARLGEAGQAEVTR